tara:strand:+ start:1206 stop:2579 length:1374 start_codon:yes stop_codon:yes gene_type:complete
MITKKNINKVFFIFLFFHLFFWTLVPSLSNINLPLDTIEALAWGSNLDWGYNKHPPLSAFFLELFYFIFGPQDWAYYLLSQIFVIVAFFIIWLLSIEIFKEKKYALISIFLLEGIFFYNFTTPEFNVNICQLPFWAASLFFTWRCIKYKNTFDYLFLGVFIGLGILSKYLFIYLVIGIFSLLVFLIYTKKQIRLYNLFFVGFISLVIVSPHLSWLIKNDFVTLAYGFKRTGGIGTLSDHLIFPISLIFKQLVLLIPFFLMFLFLIKRFKYQKIYKNDKSIFLFFTCLVPIFLIILTSLILGAKIRTMWMTPFYLLFGTLFIEIFKKSINFNKIKKFYAVFLFFLILSPTAYFAVSFLSDHKRTDYEGREIARLVQNKWDDNFVNDIKIVVGDEWYAGNLSYHLSSRPKWIIDLSNRTSELDVDDGVIYTGNPKILKKICPGIFGTIKPVGYCMIGIK